MGSSDLPQHTVRQRGGRGICTGAGMRGLHAGLTPGHNTGCEQDHICELEVQPPLEVGPRGSWPTWGTGRFSFQLEQHSLDWGCMSPRHCCGAHKAPLGLVWATRTCLPLQLLFGAACKGWQPVLPPGCLFFPTTLAPHWRSHLPGAEAVLSPAQGQRQWV